MSTEINELADILSREQDIFREYLDLLTEQQRYLMCNDVESVKETIERINKLAQDAADLENGRARMVRRLQEGGKLTPEQNSLGTILKKFEGPQFAELALLKETLLEIHQKIIEQKTRNELLIEQSMKTIAHTMQYIHDFSNPKATYENPANSKRDTKQGALISRTL